MSLRALVALAVIHGLLAASLAAAGPERAMVVVNADSWASTCVANHYVHARGIPPSHVLHLSDLGSFERMPVEEFRQRILGPVLQAIEDRGLKSQIDYVLYSADFPTAIQVAADIGDRKLPRILTPQASINGLTYLHASVMAKDIRYLDLAINRYARRAMTAAGDSPWSDVDQRRYAEAIARFEQLELGRRHRKKPEKDGGTTSPTTPADKAALAKTLGEVAGTLEDLRGKHPHSADLLYNLACVQTQRGLVDKAIEALCGAVKAGWWNYGHAARDSDLESLRGRADFKQLLETMKAAKFEIQDPAPFASSKGWLADGRPAETGQGDHYLLSTVLAYTSGRGNSVRESLACLSRSIAADLTRPSGTIYFLENDNIRSTTRAWGFRRAAEKLQALHVAAAVEPGILPQRRDDVAGLTAGTATFNWPASASKILPGAICEHLTSCGGMLHERDGQTPLSEFLRYGAAGASGTVAEPYAIQAKFPTPFVHWFYAQGCTLAEAFYQSVSGPYQLLIVGDALCRPWGLPLELAIDGAGPRSVVKGTLKIAVRAKGPPAEPIAYEFYLDARQVPADGSGTSLTIDTTRVADGPHEIQVVARGKKSVGLRGTAVLPIRIGNGDQVLEVSSPPSAVIAWNRPLEITARLAGAKEIVFFHHSRAVATLPASAGRVRIDPRLLGQGPSRIRPVGKLPSGKEVWGQPIDVNVVPPDPLPPQTPPGKLNPGIALSSAGRPAPIISRGEGDWITKAGVKPKDPFVVEAWFEVPDDDTYQFQVRGDGRTLRVDGVAQDWPRGRQWWYVPVALKRGWHRLRLEGVGGTSPSLDVRFGGRGTLRLDAAWCRADPKP